jgi:capsid protein
MTMQHRIAALTWLLCATAAQAHHSFAPVYDGKRIVTKTGVITAFRLVNPHTMMTLDVTDDAGNVVQWTVEFDGRLNLTHYGWTDQTIKVGERVTVTGNPTHKASPRMSFMELERPDGTQLRRPMVDYALGTLEDARRKRAEQQAPPSP